MTVYFFSVPPGYDNIWWSWYDILQWEGKVHKFAFTINLEVPICFKRWWYLIVKNEGHKLCDNCLGSYISHVHIISTCYFRLIIMVFLSMINPCKRLILVSLFSDVVVFIECCWTRECVVLVGTEKCKWLCSFKVRFKFVWIKHMIFLTNLVLLIYSNQLQWQRIEK